MEGHNNVKLELKTLTPEQQQTQCSRLSHQVYQVCVRIFEELETKGVIFGNGHHMAQSVSTYATDLLRSRFNEPNQPTEPKEPT